MSTDVGTDSPETNQTKVELIDDRNGKRLKAIPTKGFAWPGFPHWDISSAACRQNRTFLRTICEQKNVIIGCWSTWSLVQFIPDLWNTLDVLRGNWWRLEGVPKKEPVTPSNRRTQISPLETWGGSSCMWTNHQPWHKPNQSCAPWQKRVLCFILRWILAF